MVLITNKMNSKRNAKLSRTLFVMITASLLFWVPSLVVYSTNVLCSKCVPLLVFQIFNLFRLANSLVNPIIYSFRIGMFRKTFKRVKLHKQSKKYKIYYTPWNLIEDRNGPDLPRFQESFVELSPVFHKLWPVANHQATHSHMQRCLVTRELLCHVRNESHIEAKLWNVTSPLLIMNKVNSLSFLVKIIVTKQSSLNSDLSMLTRALALFVSSRTP